MQIAFSILFFVLGSCFGSFLCCQVRRLHLKSSSTDQPASYKKTTKKNASNLPTRSICLECHYQLKWYDNIPIISWLSLHGKCRKCHQRIGLAELLSELGLALAFLALSTTIDLKTADILTWLVFASTIIFIIILGFLAIYDGIYGELPSRALTLAIVFSIVIFLLKEYSHFSSITISPELVLNPLLSILILGGLYLVLYKVSKGKWVGDGDWLLGLALGLALCDPWLALITLFLANLFATIVMYPTARKKKHAKIYFGPFLVAAYIVVVTFAPALTSLIQ